MSDAARRRGLAIVLAVMGGLYAVVGYWPPFVLGGILLLLVIAVVARLGRDEPSPDPRPADPGQVRWARR